MKSNSVKMGSPQSGMTIIELVVAMAIIGFLSMMAYPTYVNYMVEVRRSDGQIALTKFSQWLERYYTMNNQYYTGATISDVYNLSSDEGYYSLTYSGATVSYIISAVPQSPQDVDTDCATLKLNELGQKSATGTLGNEACW